MPQSQGVEEWKAETTAFDRVESISTCLDEPQPAGKIADEAHVAENTARSHLSRLCSLGILQSESIEGVTVFFPDPLYTRMRTLRDLLDEYTQDGLIEHRATLKENIQTWKDKYNVESPQELRQKAAHADETERIRDFGKAASEWEHTQYRLSVVSDAIENYQQYNAINPSLTEITTQPR